jgi:hypothetical protein
MIVSKKKGFEVAVVGGFEAPLSRVTSKVSPAYNSRCSECDTLKEPSALST